MVNGIHVWIELSATVIEALAGAIIGAAVLVGTIV
jgi:hypothetical protein